MVITLICQNCFYSWDYKGFGLFNKKYPRACCPKCHFDVPLNKKNKLLKDNMLD